MPVFVVSSPYQDISKGSSSQSEPEARFGVDKDKFKPASTFLLFSLLVLFPPTPRTREDELSPFLIPRSSKACDQAVTAGRMISTGEIYELSTLVLVPVMLKRELKKFRKSPQENSLTLEGCYNLTENILL